MLLRPLMIVPVLGVGLAMPVAAQQNNPLPSSGTFKLHSGWKGIGETTKISEDHTFGSGNFWGVSFNDAGSGPLHVGPVVCAYTLDTVGGAGTLQGACAWGDADGDKIFTSYVGKVSTSGALDGMNNITGGTGKFDGIQGRAPFHCQFLNDQSQAMCTQQFEYQLAKKVILRRRARPQGRSGDHPPARGTGRSRHGLPSARRFRGLANAQDEDP